MTPHMPIHKHLTGEEQARTDLLSLLFGAILVFCIALMIILVIVPELGKLMPILLHLLHLG